jgi:hypothetical protein
MRANLNILSVLVVPLVLVSISPSPSVAINTVNTEATVTTAIEQVARDFAEGVAAGNAGSVRSAIDPGVQMLSIGKLPNGRELVSFTTYSQLLETAAARERNAAQDDAVVKVTVLDVYKNTSSVHIEKRKSGVYLHIGRINGQWKVVNELRISNPRAASKEDHQGIERSGMDYVDGFYEGSPEREVRALYPSLHKVHVRQLPNGREYLSRMDRMTVEELARAGAGNKPVDERRVSVRILQASAGSAAIAIPSSSFYDLAHVVKLNGEWKIVNVLWIPN